MININYLSSVTQCQSMIYEGRRSFSLMQTPDYGMINSAYGIAYSLVTSRDKLKAEVEKMLATEGPYILECAVKEEENVLPMIPPGKSICDMLLEL